MEYLNLMFLFLCIDGEINKSLVIASRGDSLKDYYHVKMNPEQIIAQWYKGNNVEMAFRLIRVAI